MTDVIDAALASTAEWECRIGSWLGGEYLGEVPISEGTITWSKNRDVPGTISLKVPEIDEDGTSWNPGGDPTHPLARYGQELTVDITVRDPVSRVEESFEMGRYLITAWDADEDIAVEGESLFKRIEDDRFLAPMSSRHGALLASEARRLVPGSLPVSIDAGLPARACPARSWDESRTDALLEVADAWPARIRETRDGVIAFLPPLPEVPLPELHYTDGLNGTMVKAPIFDAREGIYNIVVVRGQETTEDGLPSFQAVSRQTSGPLDCNGPYGAVPKFFSSPLITTKAQAVQAADSMRKNSVRSTKVRKVTCAPDPRPWIDTPVALTINQSTLEELTEWGFISGFTLDLLAAQDMTIETEMV